MNTELETDLFAGSAEIMRLLSTRVSDRQWTELQSKKDNSFAAEIGRSHPHLRLKKVLDPRRECQRWAVSVKGAAELLGMDRKTLLNIISNPWSASFEVICPTKASPNSQKVHKFVWLSELFDYAKKMSEVSDEPI